MDRSARIVSFHTVFALMVAAGTALAGPLSPPAGPISSTYKTLTEIEPRTALSSVPFTITQPGSYYLTGNMTLAANQVGIEVLADNVTVDLNGFAIDGGGVSEDGVRVGASGVGGRKNVVIKNGTIRGTAKDGIDAFASTNVRVENVSVDTATGGTGIITGKNAVISNCVVRNTGAGVVVGSDSIISDSISDGSTGQAGFVAGDNSTVRNCIAANGKSGIRVGKNSLVESCTARSNYGNGPEDGTGIRVGPWSRVIDCVAHDNRGFVDPSGSASTGGSGFFVEQGGSVSGCNASGNIPDGFSFSFSVVAIGCNANGNVRYGIGVDGSVTLTNCTANSNGSHGLLQGGTIVGSTIRNCTFAYNSGAGVRIAQESFGTTLDGCTIRYNALDGIKVDSTGNAITNNVLNWNGRGAGDQSSINLIGGNNVVEGNVLSSAEIGILAVGAGNVVRRNTAMAHPVANYQFGAGTLFGPIVNAPAGGDLSAFAIGNHPAANISK